MKLQEFLTFRKTCFVCAAPITFRVTNWTDEVNPITLHVSQVIGMNILKFYNKASCIYLNLKTNKYIISPNASQQIHLLIEGSCKKDHVHYNYESQMIILDYVKNVWGEFSDIETEEIIQIDNGSIFSVVNSYAGHRTTIVFPGGKERVVLPLVNTADSSLEELGNKLKVYLTFR